MDSTVTAVLDRLYQDDANQRSARLPVEARTRNLTRTSGKYLSLFARAMRATRVIEIGSSNGVSTIWFATAMRSTGGFVTGTEIIRERAAEANSNIAEAGLSDFGVVLPGPAGASLVNEPGPFDLVFIDAEKEDYVAHFHLIWDRVRIGGVVIADNVTSHDISDYQQMVRSRGDCDTVTVTLERGLEVTIRTN